MDDDSRRLAQIAARHVPDLPTDANLAAFARQLASSRILGYQNGKEWYDVHPLIRDEVLAHAGRLDP